MMLLSAGIPDGGIRHESDDLFRYLALVAVVDRRLDGGFATSLFFSTLGLDRFLERRRKLWVFVYLPDDWRPAVWKINGRRCRPFFAESLRQAGNAAAQSRIK